MKAAFFDFDGVIVDTVGVKNQLFIELAMTHSREVGDALAIALVGELVGAERQRVMAWICRASKGALSEAWLLDEFSSRLAPRLLNAPLIPGVASYIARLEAAGVMLAIVSAAPEADIRRQLLANGFKSTTFKAIKGQRDGSKESCAKDLLQENALKARDVVFFGDMPTDEAVAEGLGMRFVRIDGTIGRRCQWSGKKHLMISSFDELEGRVI